MRSELGPHPDRSPLAEPPTVADLHHVLEPIVALDTGRVVAHEILARPCSGEGFETWSAGCLRRLAPQLVRSALEFAGVADGLGAVDGIVHLNVTALDLIRPGFVDEVCEILSPALCGRVVLEITEQFPIVDSSATRSALARLRARGLRFAIDDFGEGWSNLEAVHVVRPEVIKVTWRMLGSSDYEAALTDWVLRLARRLGASTVLEQIETSERARWAMRRGFTMGQGYQWA